jgi:hypothetical protein
MAGSPGVSRALPEPRLNGFVPSARIHGGLVALKSSGKVFGCHRAREKEPAKGDGLDDPAAFGCFLNALSKVRRGARGGI